MSSQRKIEKQYEEYRQLTEQVKQATEIPRIETEQEKNARIAQLKRNYAAFFSYYFPNYATFSCAKFHIEAANHILKHPDCRLILEWFRGAAKSTHANMGVPMWLMIQDDAQLRRPDGTPYTRRQLNYFLQVGASQEAANKLLLKLQAQLEGNQRFIADFGPQVRYGSWAQGAFETISGRRFEALGLEGNIRGRGNDQYRPDMIVLDDIEDDEMARNPDRVGNAYNWIQQAAIGAMDVGLGRVVVANNRFADAGIVARLSSGSTYTTLRVNAIDAKGQPTWPEKYTLAFFESRRKDLGPISFEREYMNNPVVDGKVFKPDWIRWEKTLRLDRYDSLVLYIDPSFTHTKHSDFKAVKVWGKAGRDLHLIDCFVRRASIPEMIRWCFEFVQQVPDSAVLHCYIEDQFYNNALFKDEVYRQAPSYEKPFHLMPDTRKKPNKAERIESLQPLYYNLNVVYNERLRDSPDVKEAVAQLLAFGPGSRYADDSPDADEGAIYLLERRHRQASSSPILMQRRQSHRY